MCSDTIALTKLTTSLARNTGPDANILHYVTLRDLGLLCDKIADEFTTILNIPTKIRRGTAWDLMHIFVSAWQTTCPGVAENWSIRETHDGWEAYLDDTLVFVAYTDYTDGSVDATFPGPSDGYEST